MKISIESIKESLKKDFKKKLLNFIVEAIKIIVVLAICAGIGIFYAIGERAGSPQRYAEQYFSYFVTNNYEKMYDMVDCNGSEFINRENFINKCEGEKVYGSITGYKLSKPIEVGDNITYVVTYYIGADKKPNTYTITLNRQIEKTHMFFDTWKVSLERFMIHDYSISVPVGTRVLMDGVDIEKYKKSTSEDGTLDNYVVNRIFSGDHTVSVHLDATGEITKTQYVTEETDSILITTNDFAIKPDVQQKLFEYSASIIEFMYQYSMDKTKNAEDLAILYAHTPEAQESAKSSFNTLAAAITKADGAQMKELDIKTLSPEVISFTYPDRVTVKVDYDYTFKAITGTTVLSGIVEEYEGAGNSTAFVYLNLIDNAWKVVKVDLECVDYSKQS